MVRKTRTSLSETGLATLETHVLGPLHPIVLTGGHRRLRTTYNFPDGGEIITGGLDHPERILSSEYDIIFVMQAEETTQREWEILLTRLRNNVLPYQQIIGDCNPGPPSHWIQERFSSGLLQLWQTYHRDNPLLWDAKSNDYTEYGQNYMGKLKQLTGIMRERFLEGKWTQAEGVVYSEFSMENVVDTEPNPDLPIEIACDDGYVDPRAILFIQRTGTEILVFDELYHSRHLAETCVSEIVERCERNGWPLPEIAVGSPEAKEMQQRFRLADIPFRSRVHKILDGIPIVRGLIRDGNGVRSLKVHRRCKNLIGELTDGYRYPELGSRRDDEKPLDGNDHACDALRYWCFTRARS